MNTLEIISQLNALIDQAPIDIINGALEKLNEEIDEHLDNSFGQYSAYRIRENAREILVKFAKDLAPVRREINVHDFKGSEIKEALSNITEAIAHVEAYTKEPDVIAYAEHLAREIMRATNQDN